jgi:hypothetical protein
MSRAGRRPAILRVEGCEAVGSEPHDATRRGGRSHTLALRDGEIML